VTRTSPPALCGVLVHWHDETGAAALAAAWPDDSRFELLVVDNGSTTDLDIGSHRVLRPAANLGFGGAVNLALEHTRAPIVLILNSDACPEGDALQQLLEGFAKHRDVAGLAPRLVGPDGRTQHRWQLRTLPAPWQLLLQTLMLPVWHGPRAEPAPETPVEQPAAAVLAIRRRCLTAAGGFDDAFYPAWFEDVDLAARLKARGERFLYWPAARFSHRLGSSVDRLGYGRFLWIHYRNLTLYLRKHHPIAWTTAARLLLVPASILRIPLLPLRRPKRAGSRREAASGLLTLAGGALTGWRWPRQFTAPSAAEAGRPEEA
jgi:N-acetylglucosaminyl-diphospho-decaprenol L-rhamnosyltransferase